MPRIAGRKSYFSVDHVNVSLFCNNVDFPRSAEQLETTGLTNKARQRIIGFKDATIRASGLWDDGQGVVSQDHIMFNVLGASPPKAWAYGQEGDASGDRKYSGTPATSAGLSDGGIFATTYTVSCSVDGVVTLDFECQIDGAPTRGTF